MRAGISQNFCTDDIFTWDWLSSNINSLVVPAARIALAASETDAISIDKESIMGISRYSYNAFTEIRILDMEDFTG